MASIVPGTSGRYLEQTAPGDLFRVRVVAFEFVPFSCSDLRIRVGDVLRHVASDPEGFVVAHLDGRHLRIPEACARFIGVHRLGRGQGPGEQPRDPELPEPDEPERPKPGDPERGPPGDPVPPEPGEPERPQPGDPEPETPEGWTDAPSA